ncbi:hypothetical protein HYH03_005658 [Edaphochlamys debaryana]|uniref:MYND-type domain-containing protein n=1 Tax=Edaphochlamys debaryana TaxID=47281 RepID=A0A836C2C1_9CHLO|nr:hypothetical protein HYH03_005658 [Edaphochlamys debaryana]|eukprot:KAG2496434.1 hypothetical protein HYH03_005658 [Edaphochlamys debaryana]
MARADHLGALSADDKEEERQRRIHAFCNAEAELNAAVRRLGYDSWTTSSQDEGAQPKVLWLAALSSAGAPAWFLRQLRALPALVANAERLDASAGSSPAASRRSAEANAACDALGTCCEGAVIALVLSLQTLRCLDPIQDWAHVRLYGAPFFEAGFMQALSEAASSLAAAAQGSASRPPGPDGTELSETVARGCALISMVASTHFSWVTRIIAAHVQVHALRPLRSGAACGPLSEPVVRLPAALRDSELLASAARYILACPGPDFLLLPGQALRGHNAALVAEAEAETEASVGLPFRRRPKYQPSFFATAVAMLVNVARRISESTPQRQPLPAALQCLGRTLGQALDQPDVAALRLAMLETVWEQAGMGPAAGGAADSGLHGGQGAEEEGHSEDDLRLLWEYQRHVITASLGLWQEASSRVLCAPHGCRLPPERGVRPALQLARTAARTAEAICRLSRGQGLAGTYGPSVWRSLFMDLVDIRACLLPPETPMQTPPPRPAPEAACWAEAAAFLLPVACHALEAALKQPSPSPAMTFIQVEDLNQCMGALSTPAEAWPAGSQGPGDLRCRLRRADLGTSLDHAQRLGFAAEDRISEHTAARAASPEFLSSRLGPLPIRLLQAVLHLRLTPLAHAGSGGGGGGGGGSGGAGGELVLGGTGGLALTCGKRALALAVRIEGAAAGGLAQAGAQPSCAPDSPAPLLAALGTYASHVSRLRESVTEGAGTAGRGAPAPAGARAASARAGGRRGPAAAGPASGGGTSGAGGGALGAELEAYVMQATARLAAAAVAYPTVLDCTAAPEGTQANLMRTNAGETAIKELSTSLGYVAALCGTPESLAAQGRLLACQPHRLLAAGCKVLCARRYPTAETSSLGAAMARDAALAVKLTHSLVLALGRMGSHPGLSARVRRWLLPPSPQPVSEAGTATQAELEAGAEERGCLQRAWGAGMSVGRQAGGEAGQLAAAGLALLYAQPAGGSGEGSGSGSGGGSGGGSGSRGGGEQAGDAGAEAAFRQAAASLAEWAAARNPTVSGRSAGRLPPLPPALTRGLAAADIAATAAPGMQAAAEVLRAPLPPLLAVPPAGQVRTRLRVCGFPSCVSYGGRSEADLLLKQCGGCKAVRYCGPECQRSHWREGHRGECGAMTAARAAGEQE